MNWKNAIFALALILALVFLIWLLFEKSRSSDLARDLERLRYSSSQTGEQLSEAQRQRDQQARQLSDKDREINRLQTESERNAATAKRRADSLQREVDSLRSVESNAQAEIDKQRQAAEAAARELAAAQSRLAELEKGLAENAAAPVDNAEYQALLSSRDEAQARIESLSDNLDQVQAENERLRREAEAAARSEEEFEALNARLSQARAELDQARSEIERLEKELAERPEPGSPAEPAENQEGDDREARSELEGLRLELDASRAEAARLDGQLARAAESEREARTGLADCQKLSAAQKERVAALETEAGGLLAEKEALRDSVSTVFVDQLLFNSGSVTLSEPGLEVLEAAARVVNQSPDRAVLVVGHSDDQAPNRQLSRYYPSNWELSAARAAAVVRHLTEKGGVDPVRLSLVGRSHYQPAARNESDEDRRQNRRVEIIISNHLRPAAP